MNLTLVGRKKSDWPIVKKRLYPTGNIAGIVDCGMVNGRRPRFTYDTKGEAETKAEQVRIERENDGNFYTLRPRPVRRRRALAILAPFNVSLSAAAEFYKTHAGLIQNKRTVSQVADELLVAKAQDNLSARHRKDLRGGNVLALDEPTNDLDLGTLRLLEEALVAFDGSVVVVSHDRYFLKRVCASILAFEGDGVVRYSIGNYDYYLEKRAERLASSAATPTTASSAPGSERLMTAQRLGKLKWSERQELETIEDKILAAEEDLVRLEAQFAEPDFYTKHGRHWQMFDAQLQTARENVSQLYSRWEELERIRAER